MCDDQSDRSTTEASLPLEDRVAEDGFVYLPEPCASDWVEHVLSVAKTHARKVREALGDHEIGIGSAAGYDEIVQRSPGRWDLPITSQQFGVDDQELPWWPLVTAILGADAEPSFSGIVFSDPATPAQEWHIDSPHVGAEHLAAHALNVLVALHDVPLAMGPTEFARGSHRMTNHLADDTLVMDELVYQHDGTTPEVLVRGREQSPPERCVRALRKQG